MITPWGVWAVFRFEFRRTLTLSRYLMWGALACFPALLVALVLYAGNEPPAAEVWHFALYILTVGVVTNLGLLAWAAPMVHAELEGRTWAYLAIRPCGIGSVLVGKYLNAVAWAAPAAWTAATLCIVMAQPTGAVSLWLTLIGLATLSALTYGAIFTFISAVFLKRAMVVAVSYVLMMEVLVSFVPAMINEFTVQFRLRTLLKSAMWRELPRETQMMFGDAPAWQQIGILLLVSFAMLAAATLVLRLRELTAAEESQ